MGSLPHESRLRERAVLGLSLASGLGLAWAALVTTGDPGAAGDLAVARLSGAVAADVERDWRAWLATTDAPAAARGHEFEWRPGRLARETRVTPVDCGVGDPAGASVFEALMSDARRLELVEADLAEARKVVEEAGRLEGLSECEVARVRLYALQLAARADDPEAARGRWRELLDVPGSLVEDGVSILLLAGLAVGPLLPPVERASLQARLVEAWCTGSLVLPEPRSGRAVELEYGLEFEQATILEAYEQRLRALAPGGSVAERLREDREEARARVLAERVAEPVEVYGTWGVQETRLGTLLVRCSAGPEAGTCAARLVDLAELCAAFARTLSVADGFAVDFTGEDETLGGRVHGPVPLARGVDFVVRHRDPAALREAERGRVWILRGALLALASLTAVAGLFVSRAMARERKLARLKTEFIAGVSHDLRTPLASILLMAENLESGRVTTDSSRERYYSSIRREAQRLRRLVEDVLDFSRIERGREVERRLEDVCLPSFLDQLGEEVRERVSAAGGELSCERGEVPREAALDADAVRRAVMNLVENALRHCESTDVALRFESPSARELAIVVGDRGRGIPAGKREAIFRPFTQLGSANGAEIGTGLGLAIVREVARAHGGTASVAPGPDGVGSEFELRLMIDGETEEGPA